jgi:predicted ribosomally synthesized peptide with SipW-like signal peptide
MLHLINTKVLLSGATILAASAVIIGATFAFFSDTETSTGNTFVAGEIDLQIDSEAHYAGLVCTENGVWAEEVTGESTRPDLIDEECEGTWSLKDLGEGDIFFSLNDIKPGDSGENTISLHVFNNDAWGRMVIDNVTSLDITCNEPESEDPDDPECILPSPTPGAGELQGNIAFSIWLDQGVTPGFQNTEDGGEGDNVQQCDNPQDPLECDEPTLVTSGPLDPGGETLNIWEGLDPVYDFYSCTGDGSETGADCPGLTNDGHLVGSITYYFGLDWEIPDTVGNEVQTDSLSADISFEATQYRNNPSQQF